MSLNDKLCMVRPTLIDLNPVEFKYYPYMISLDKCSGSCNVSSPKICVLKKNKRHNVKAFTMITTKMKVKQWQNVFHVIVNAYSIVQYVQSNLYKTTTLGTTQKWSSWTGGRLVKHCYKTTTNQIWSLVAGF